MTRTGVAWVAGALLLVAAVTATVIRELRKPLFRW